MHTIQEMLDQEWSGLRSFLHKIALLFNHCLKGYQLLNLLVQLYCWQQLYLQTAVSIMLYISPCFEKLHLLMLVCLLREKSGAKDFWQISWKL